MNQFYLKQNNSYKLIEKNLFEKIMLVVFIVSLIYFLFKGYKTSENIPMWVLFVFPTLVYLFKVSKKVAFNKDKATLEISSFFNLYKKEYNLKNFHKFLIIKHRMNFINNGKEVKILFKNNQEVSLTRRSKFKNVDVFIDETEKIIKS